MEEADIRSAEVKKSSYEFERDIVKGAVNEVIIVCISTCQTKYKLIIKNSFYSI